MTQNDLNTLENAISKSKESTNEILIEIRDLFREGNKYAPYQLCPKCNGVGVVQGYGTSSFPTCDVCNGAKIIPQSRIS